MSEGINMNNVHAKLSGAPKENEIVDPYAGIAEDIAEVTGENPEVVQNMLNEDEESVTPEHPGSLN